MITLHTPIDLKKLIKESKYTQSKLAKALRMSRNALVRLLSRDISELTITQLDEILSLLGFNMRIIVE